MMKTTLVWLLLSVGDPGGRVGIAPIAKFADVAECERVRVLVENDVHWRRLRCVQARVIDEGGKP